MMAILSLAVASNFSAAKEKKSTLPGYVLEEQTVFVMIDPDAGTAVNDPQGNRMAREDVEKALMRWGRLKPVMTMSLADLVIVIRKGNTQAVQPTVGGEPTNDRPAIAQGTGGTSRVAGQQGRPPGAGGEGGPTRAGAMDGGTGGPARGVSEAGDFDLREWGADGGGRVFPQGVGAYSSGESKVRPRTLRQRREGMRHPASLKS